MERLAGRIILLWGWRRFAVAFLAGAVLVLTQAPYDFFAAGLVSFPMLVWLLDGATGDGSRNPVKRLLPAFATGWWFGFGYFLAGLWWIGGALLIEADSFAWALPFAVVGIPLLMAFFYGFATAVARLMWGDGVVRIFALAFAFGLAEWLRGFLFTGFPWNPVGFAVMPTPLLMQSVVLTGVAGMNALAVLVLAMPALLGGRRDRLAGLVLAGGLVLAHAGFGYMRLQEPAPAASASMAVRLVQPSVDLSEKWDETSRDRIFANLLELSGRAAAPGAPQPQLIVWPETSVPFFFTERPDALVAIGQMLKPGQMLLAGMEREERTGGGPLYYNSVVAINDEGEIVDAVDKVHLVPFGEYIPFEKMAARIGLQQLVAGRGNFVAGSTRHPISLPGGIRAAAYICYEIIFPDLVAEGARTTGLIVNVTNDAWFGDTPGPYQHFRQAQVRAVENGLPLLRSANHGISGIIDSRGHVLDALKLNAIASVDGVVDIPDRPDDTMASRHWAGEMIMVFLALLAIAGSVLRRTRMN